MQNTAPTAEQQEHFQAWRTDALGIMPYMAAMLFSLRPVSADWVDTFAVDPGHRIYINFGNVDRQGSRFASEGLLHECSHLLAEHSRLADAVSVAPQERRDWNLAGDMAINDDLRDGGCAVLAGYGMFAEHIGMPDYRDPTEYMAAIRALRQQMPPTAGGQCSECGQGQNEKDSDEQSQSGAGDDDDQGGAGDGGSSGQETGQQGDQDGSDCPSCGQARPQFSGCGSGSGGQPGWGELDGEDDMGGQAPAASAAEQINVRVRTVADIREHIKSRGSVPAGLVQMIELVLQPTKTPWERLLRSTVRRALARRMGHFDQDRTRRNRRRMNDQLVDVATGASRGRVIVPGYYQPLPKVMFMRDTSGSVSSKELAEISNEIVTVSRKMGLRGDDLIVCDLDTEVHQRTSYRRFQDLAKVAGRGGTDMRKAIEYAESSPQVPSVLVVATDGETPWPTQAPNFPVVIALTQEPTYFTAPEWARVVRIDQP